MRSVRSPRIRTPGRSPAAARKRWPHVVIAIFLTGCMRAPSVDIIGSFFPGWMICLVIGVLLTFAVRYGLLRLRLESEVGPLALFYPSLLTLLTSLLWLVYFR
jgi:hypothetical protein